MRYTFQACLDDRQWFTSAGRWQELPDAASAAGEYLRICAKAGKLAAVRLMFATDLDDFKDEGKPT